MVKIKKSSERSKEKCFREGKCIKGRRWKKNEKKPIRIIGRKSQRERTDKEIMERQKM